MSFLTPTDNQGLLHFLRTWYGPPTSPRVKLHEVSDVPKVLLEWHELSAQWGGMITSHNYAIPLPELAAEDGKVPFWVENQGTWVWAFDPDSEGHTVYERLPSDDPPPWKPTGEQLSEFLIHATVVEAILNAPAMKVAEEVKSDWLSSLEGSRELPFPAWNWPTSDSRIVSGDEWLALVHPSDGPDSGFDITLGATAPESLAWADALPEVKWRSYFNA